MMACSIALNSMAHQWRKPFCSTIEKSLRQKLMARSRSIGAFPMAHAWRKPPAHATPALRLWLRLSRRPLTPCQAALAQQGNALPAAIAPICPRPNRGGGTALARAKRSRDGSRAASHGDHGAIQIPIPIITSDTAITSRSIVSHCGIRFAPCSVMASALRDPDAASEGRELV
jgi:hypothetical protein